MRFGMVCRVWLVHLEHTMSVFSMLCTDGRVLLERCFLQKIMAQKFGIFLDDAWPNFNRSPTKIEMEIGYWTEHTHIRGIPIGITRNRTTLLWRDKYWDKE